MLDAVGRIACTGFRQISRIVGSALSSPSIASPYRSAPVPVKLDVPIRQKCFEHHFLNRWMARDYKRRVLVKKHYPHRQRYVALKRCSLLPREFQEVAGQELHEFPRDSCMPRLKGRCIMTSRPRWVIPQYRLSRIQYRLLADYNKLSGINRATW